jgi:predicted MFS family arabinose efflux permease
VRFIVFILSVAGFAAIAVMRVVDPLLPVIAGEFKVGIGDASLIITAYSMTYGLCVLFYGPLGDRFGKLRVILISMTLSATTIALCGTARELSDLVTWRFFTGMLGAATVPLSLAFIGDHVPIADRQRALGNYMSGVVLGQVAGAGVGGIWADHFGWRSLFFAYGAFTLGVALLVFVYTRRLTLPAAPVTQLSGALSRYSRVLTFREGREVMAGVFLEGMLLFGGTAFLGALLREAYGVSLTAVGLLLMCVGLGSLAYTLSVAWLMRRLGPRRMIASSGVLMLLAFFGLAFSRNWAVAAPLLTLLGFAIYLMHNTLQTLSTELLPEARGSAVSMMAFVLFAGQASGAWMLGRVIDRFGYTPGLAFSGAGLLLLAAWLQGTRVVRHHHAR